MSAFSAELTGEFDILISKIKDLLTSYRRGIGASDESERKALFQQIDGLMAEEGDIYKQLELELRGAAGKAALALRKESHLSIKQEFANVKQDHQRALLLASGGAAEKVVYQDAQREKLENSRKKWGTKYLTASL